MQVLDISRLASRIFQVHQDRGNVLDVPCEAGLW